MNMKLATGLVTGLLLGVVVGSLRGPAVSNAQAPEKRTAWEYKVVAFAPNDSTGQTKQINAMAREGWEYVGLLSLHVRQREPSMSTVLFKREKP